jgi:hypothetical protein
MPILGSVSRRVLQSRCQHHVSNHFHGVPDDLPALLMELCQPFHKLLILTRAFDGKPAFGRHGELVARARETSAS